MRLKKSKWLLFAVGLTIVSIAVIATVFCVLLFQPPEKRITAMEGKGKADELALEWDTSAALIYVVGGSIDSKGKTIEWRYQYTNQNRSKELDVFIYSNKEPKVNEYVRHSTKIPLSNWTIDSDQAINIALASQEINIFLSKFNDAKVERMSLYIDLSFSENAIWDISWHSPGIMDNPHNAYALIDAHTASLLKVETQMD